MSRLSSFFKDADTELGIFYPKHAGLNHADRVDEDAISVSGDEVVHFAEDHLRHDGLHRPTDEAQTAAWKTIEPAHPLVARYTGEN